MAFQHAISDLQQGRMTLITPKGHSMEPRIKSGQKVVLKPVGEHTSLRVGDIVLAKVKGSIFLHKISALEGDRVQISNNKGHVNGWTVKHKVYGRAV